jgi:protein-tyrosine phosphatase
MVLYAVISAAVDPPQNATGMEPMIESNPRVRSILFVCTGNVFRSVAAEYGLKTLVGQPSPYHIGSAGIEAKPQAVHDWVKGCLREKGADVSRHVQRRLTSELMAETDLVIAMSRDHQDFIQREFGRHAPLFKQLCYGRDEPIPDLHELYPDWGQDLALARAYVASVIDIIWVDLPSLLSKLPHERPTTST